MGNCRTEKAIHCQQKRGGATIDPKYVKTMPQAEQKRLSACGLSDTTHSSLPLLPMPYYVWSSEGLLLLSRFGCQCQHSGCVQAV